MSWFERLSTGQAAERGTPDASVSAAGGNLARNRQDKADVIDGRYGRSGRRRWFARSGACCRREWTTSSDRAWNSVDWSTSPFRSLSDDTAAAGHQAASDPVIAILLTLSRTTVVTGNGDLVTNDFIAARSPLREHTDSLRSRWVAACWRRAIHPRGPIQAGHSREQAQYPSGSVPVETTVLHDALSRHRCCYAETRPDQLSRSTSAGSIRDARYAGSHPASAPTAASVTAAPTSVAGSRGSSP
jgi:hypothetical protein